jgi:hypothetical protein
MPNKPNHWNFCRLWTAAPVEDKKQPLEKNPSIVARLWYKAAALFISGCDADHSPPSSAEVMNE